MDQEKMMELQILSQQIEQLQQYLQNMDSQIEAVTHVLEALTDVETLKGDEEVFMPITNGIFIKGRITHAKKLLVNVGADTVVEKSVEDTRKLLTSQKDEIEKYKTEALGQFQELLTRVTELQEEYKTSRG
ncbi:MAG: prefoldin subunit alpha [Nanoarchaeota archaeon]